MNMGHTAYGAASVCVLQLVNMLVILSVELSGLTVDPLVRMS